MNFYIFYQVCKIKFELPNLQNLENDILKNISGKSLKCRKSKNSDQKDNLVEKLECTLKITKLVILIKKIRL